MSSAPLRVVFMGTPHFAVPPLDALAGDPRCSVVLVLSQPDRPSGRGMKLTPPPVAARAQALGLPVLQPESLKDDDAFDALAASRPDLIVVAAYGQILRQRVLSLPRLGCVNIHASLLPRWRGAAPIHRAVDAGDAVTGISIMRMERGLDTGPVYAMAPTMIGESETSGELHDRLALLGAELLTSSLSAIVAGDEPLPQAPSRSTYAPMLDASDRAIDFTWAARRIAWRINAMSPWPGCAATIDGERIGLLKAAATTQTTTAAPGSVAMATPEAGLLVAAGDGTLVDVQVIQRAGKRALPAREALRGFTIAPGTLLGAS